MLANTTRVIATPWRLTRISCLHGVKYTKRLLHSPVALMSTTFGFSEAPFDLIMFTERLRVSSCVDSKYTSYTYTLNNSGSKVLRPVPMMCVGFSIGRSIATSSGCNLLLYLLAQSFGRQGPAMAPGKPYVQLTRAVASFSEPQGAQTMAVKRS